MTLTVLLSAQAPSADGAGSGLAALLPVAGLTLLERQAEDAVSVGAHQLLVLVDAVPPALTAAVDRIRNRGSTVTIVRDGAAVIAAMDGPAERLMLVADGLIVPRALWEAMVSASAPRLLAVSDTPATGALERIDAQWRWAGLAMVDRSAIAALADFPADWDPQLALLRSAIQAEAPSIACEPQLFERGDIALLDRAASADLVEQRLLSRDADAVAGLLYANVLMPLARAAARLLLRGQHGGIAMRGLAIAGAVGASVAMLYGFPFLAACAALCGLLASAAGATIAAFRPESSVQRGLAFIADGVFAVAIMVTAWTAAVTYRADALLLLTTGATMVPLIQLGRILVDRQAARPPLIWDNGALWLVIGIGAIAESWLLAFAAALPLAAAAVLLAVWMNDNPKAV
jgi:hypothetical protein